MTAVIIILTVLVVGLVVFFILKNKKKEDSKPQVNNPQVESPVAALGSGALEFTFLAGKWYMCIRNYYAFVKGQVYKCEHNGCLTLNGTNYRLDHPALYFRPATEDEIPQPEPTPEPTPEPEPETDYESILDELLKYFASEIKVPKGSYTYLYMIEMVKEGFAQYYEKASKNDIPVLIKKENFPCVFNYYGDKEIETGFQVMMGWMLALFLAPLKPFRRTAIYKIGYELGGFNKYSNIYGYKLEDDPNNLRKVAAVLQSAVRSIRQPDDNQIRAEVGGYRYGKNLDELVGSDRNNVGSEDFYIDFREFLSTALGPYAPGYKTRPDKPLPDENKDSYYNLQMDRTIHEYIVNNYNLDDAINHQAVVQAIADKEGDITHLFGANRAASKFSFHPVFGEDTIGIYIDPASKLAKECETSFTCSSKARGILQSATVDPKQYGRLRPGCSWEQEAVKHSQTDNRWNILTNFVIEENDGCPTGYYDKNGNWVKPAQVKSPADYEEQQRNALYANSYPSGHSSGIMGVLLKLVEEYPHQADLILKAGNQYALNRTIARYHWTSDIINGMVLGSAQYVMMQAAKDA